MWLFELVLSLRMVLTVLDCSVDSYDSNSTESDGFGGSDNVPD